MDTIKVCTFALAYEERGSVAQLNRALDYGSRGSGFESQRSHYQNQRKSAKLDAWHFFVLITLRNSILTQSQSVIRPHETHILPKEKLLGLKQERDETLEPHLFLICRGDRIRTCDRLVPNQERYRAALHPEGTINPNCGAKVLTFIQTTKLSRLFFLQR